MTFLSTTARRLALAGALAGQVLVATMLAARVLAASVLAVSVLAAPTLASAETATVVYFGAATDPRYEPRQAYTGVVLEDLKRPVDGARLAMRDARVLGRALGARFELREVVLEEGQATAEALAEALAAGPLAVLLDLPTAQMAEALTTRRDGGTPLINISRPERRWREAECAKDLLHTTPSHDMLADALAQHLKARSWERVLLLHGTEPDDLEEAAAARRALRKFGLDLVAETTFELTNDPRRRDQSNIGLLTGSARHDVLWLVDTVREFGRTVPYNTYYPTPVVGSFGLTPEAWHVAYERHGAPQLNQRFRRQSDRDMTSADWAAWAAVRAVIESVSRVRSLDRDKVSEHMRSEALSLDLYKGVPGSFRAWNGQLRQPLLLATHEAVIAWAPVDGFQHRSDTLDTLGLDAAESRCGR